ncbi:MAG: hypothetical protein ACOC9B_00450 [Chloroflexota bacterium]
MAPRAVCSRCGAVYRGWALLDMGVVECKECGASLAIEREPQVSDLCEVGLAGVTGQAERDPQADTR